jgi:hypothetical protein
MGRVEIGRPKYGNTQRKFEKIKDGEAVWGILPPIGSLAKEGRWSVYYAIHYGYKNAAGKSRPFNSCLVKNRKPPYMIEVPDAAVERLDVLRAQLDKAKKAGDEKTKEALFKLIGGQKSLYNLDKNHYVNAIDLQGNIVVLKLRHKAKMALQEEINKLRKKGIEPLGIEDRRFFKFTRTGTGNETNYKVDVYEELITATVNGREVEVKQEYVSSLSDDVLDRLGDEAARLDQLFKSPTSEQVAQIVKEAALTTGISPNIDDILGFATDGATQEEVVDEPGDDDVTDNTASETALPLVADTTVTSTPAPTQSQDVNLTASTPVSAPKAAPAPQTTADKLTEMSDADFLKSLGIS